MDRRFVCQHCGTKWFIDEHRWSEPDLEECGRCGGPLAEFGNGSEGSQLGFGVDDPDDDD
jgi:hypothetical protein